MLSCVAGTPVVDSVRHLWPEQLLLVGPVRYSRQQQLVSVDFVVTCDNRNNLFHTLSLIPYVISDPPKPCSSRPNGAIPNGDLNLTCHVDPVMLHVNGVLRPRKYPIRATKTNANDPPMTHAFILLRCQYCAEYLAGAIAYGY